MKFPKKKKKSGKIQSVDFVSIRNFCSFWVCAYHHFPQKYPILSQNLAENQICKLL